MISLSSDHLKYIAGETGISLVINSLLSFVFALAASHGVSVMPLWGVQGMAADFVPQVFMITLATSLAVTLLARKRLLAGTVKPMGKLGGHWRRPPQRAFLRALLFGLLAVVVIAPISVAAFWLLSIRQLQTPHFIVFKVIYGAAVSTLVAPLIAVAALADPTP